MGSVFNILMVGVGGQGIITASDIVSLAAMYSGYDVKKSEIHGMSQRGGSVFSHIRFGEKVHSPVISNGDADVLFSLEEMETFRWLSCAHNGTKVFCLLNRINPIGVEHYPEGLKEELKRLCPQISFIEPEPLKEATHDARFLNVALLGLLSMHTSIEESAFSRAIREKVPKGTFDGNWEAFLAGRGFAIKN